MEIILIAAIGKNYELGKENHLIWHIPEDLAFFKKMTMGRTIVMGRKTFESLPKMLPGRRHVVLSKNGIAFDGVTCYHSLNELYEKEKESFVVIGGEQIYRLFLEKATKIYLTEIDAEEKKADAYFPNFRKENWDINILSEHQEPLLYKHVEYIKKR